MRILMVTYRFPPYNSIGAVRCGKMAKYLIELGHEVKVLSCVNQPLPSTLDVEIPKENIFYSSWWNINAPVELLLGRKNKEVTKDSLNAVGNEDTIKGLILKSLGKLYKTICHIPDGQMGWKNAAIKMGNGIISDWKPDVIYASAWPISSLIVGDKLASTNNIPWVAELRDLWTDNPYYDAPKWKLGLERVWEQRILNRAAAITTISDHAAEKLEKKYNSPVKVIFNGFDDADFGTEGGDRTSSEIFPENTINILYAGMIYPGRRDPEPLLKALTHLTDEQRTKVKLYFYGSQLNIVRQLANKLNIAENVIVKKPIAYKSIIELQRKADYLLLLMWDNPLEKGTFTGKFFEYIGAGRPILCVGGKENPPARLIKERSLGKALNKPDEIAKFLIGLIKQKENNGLIPGLPSNAGRGFSRKEQANILSEFLQQIV